MGRKMEKLHRGGKKRGWRLEGGHANDLKIHYCTILAHDVEVRSKDMSLCSFFSLKDVQTFAPGSTEPNPFILVDFHRQDVVCTL